jgi:hypothetical protein
VKSGLNWSGLVSIHCISLICGNGKDYDKIKAKRQKQKEKSKKQKAKSEQFEE